MADFRGRHSLSPIILAGMLGLPPYRLSTAGRELDEVVMGCDGFEGGNATEGSRVG